MAQIAPTRKPTDHIFVHGHAERRVWVDPPRQFFEQSDGAWMAKALVAVNSLDESRLSAITPGDWKEQMLVAAQTSVPWLWHLKLGTAAGIYTTSSEQGDVLVSLWRDLESDVPASEREKAVWLWDEPWTSLFIVKVAPAVAMDQAALARYCEDLFLWKDDMIRTLTLRTILMPDGNNWTLGGFDHPTPSGVPGATINAFVAGNEGYLIVQIPKPLVKDVYPLGGSGVPERFPPLSARLGGYTKAALIAELGSGYPMRTLGYPYHRDLIVDSELLTRGILTVSELREVVLGPFGNLNWEDPQLVLARFNALLAAIETRGQVARYASILIELLLTDSIPHRVSEQVNQRFFTGATKSMVDVSTGAIALLRNGRCGYVCLNYLGREDTEEAVRGLSELKLSPELEAKRSVVVAAIRKRMVEKARRRE